MKQAGLRVEQMSPITRPLFEVEHRFTKSVVQDTFAKKIVTTLAGRILFVAVSLITHAEAVVRAVYLCFLTLRAIFSRTGLEEIKRQREECAAAYEVSMRSLYACLDQKTLDKAVETQVLAPLHHRPAALLGRRFVQEIQAPIAAVQIEQAQQPEVQAVDLEANEPIAQVVAAEAAPQLAEEVEDADIEHVAMPDPDAVLAADIDEPLDAELPVVLDEDEDGVMLNAAVDLAVADPVPAPAAAPAADMAAVGALPPVAEPAIIQAAFAPPVAPNVMVLLQPLPQPVPWQSPFHDSDQLAVKLNKILKKAQLQMNGEVPKQFMLQEGLGAALRTDPRCTLIAPNVGRFQVGMCHFSKQDSSEKSAQIAAGFNIKMGHLEIPMQLFGIFESFGGSFAAAFMKDRFQRVLADELKKQMSHDLNEVHIVNALILACIQMDQLFKGEYRNFANLSARSYIVDQGATGVVALIVGNSLFTASLGLEKGLLVNQEGVVVPLTVPANPADPDFAKGVTNGGGFIANGLACGFLPTARGIGFDYLKKAISCQPIVTRREIHVGDQLLLGTRTLFDVGTVKEIGGALSALGQEMGPNTVFRRDPQDVAFNLAISAWYSHPRKESDFACLVVRVDDLEQVPSDFSEIDEAESSDHKSVGSNEERNYVAVSSQDLELSAADRTLEEMEAELNLDFDNESSERYVARAVPKMDLSVLPAIQVPSPDRAVASDLSPLYKISEPPSPHNSEVAIAASAAPSEAEGPAAVSISAEAPVSASPRSPSSSGVRVENGSADAVPRSPLLAGVIPEPVSPASSGVMVETGDAAEDESTQILAQSSGWSSKIFKKLW